MPTSQGSRGSGSGSAIGPRCYVGPFGRMLPIDGPSSEQQPELPANLQETGEHLYQLPPPRVPTSLQFGSDPFPRQKNSPERKDSGSESQKPEQLPSVRQILTPTPGTNSLQYSQPFASSTLNTGRRGSAYPHYHDPTFQVPSSAPDRGRAESLPQLHGLPSLSQVGLQGHRGIRSQTPTRSDPPAASFIQLPFHTSSHGQLPNGELSSPESSKRSNNQPLRPHVVDERVIDGELCFVYADGSSCPKFIDGTPVNANWGITKAGRPRKRLGLACLTCREKKIKCNPNPTAEAVCDQCRKSGRECRFESAPRGSRPPMRGPSGRPDSYAPTSHGALDVSPSLYDITRASDSATSLPGTTGHSPMPESSMKTPSSQEATYETMTEADRGLRSRSYQFPSPLSGTDETLGRPSPHAESVRSPEYSDILGKLKDSNSDDPLVASWNLDPYESDPESVAHYTECYFSHVNDGMCHMFPRGRFSSWLKTCPIKSAHDKMLLYSMMALGSVFSDRPEKMAAMTRYSRIARFAINRSQHTLSLQLAQSHIIMSLWYYATGSLVGSWDSIGAAGRAVFGLRYNVESGGVVVDHSQVCEYGLHPQALIECRRRTFWIAFVLDRFSSLYSASSTFISSDAALLRLPCREEIYETQQYATVPYFQSFLNHTPASTGDDRSTLSPMAFLIEIMAIWGDISLHITRLPHIPLEAYNRLAEEFNTTIVQKSNQWMTRLPEYLAFSPTNLERSIHQKNADTFISTHLFYHVSLMKLYRHARYQSLQPEILSQYIHRARYHAVEILRISLTFDQCAKKLTPSRNNTETSISKLTPLNPFLGYVILSAVDVLSSAGLSSQLHECIYYIRGALDAVHELGRYWDSSLQLVTVLHRRLSLMMTCLNERSVFTEKQGFALDGPPLETKVHAGALHSHPPSTTGDDLFTGSMPREMILNALRLDETLISESRIAWIRDP
ncbi:transcriptional regulator family: Fungal Specific TF [Penicillium roqueforti]|nr:transcriptional regulator family: Fungal Specific TF [Penicillium roqueforti]KAI3106123.1 transcriptional regulator family: Fungal Specific TF [Penicillium roqueforti]